MASGIPKLSHRIIMSVKMNWRYMGARVDEKIFPGNRQKKVLAVASTVELKVKTLMDKANIVAAEKIAELLWQRLQLRGISCAEFDLDKELEAMHVHHHEKLKALVNALQRHGLELEVPPKRKPRSSSEGK